MHGRSHKHKASKHSTQILTLAKPTLKQVVQFQPDSDLRDNEDVPLTGQTARGATVDAVNEAYFMKEVAPHVPDAWIDNSKCDERDKQVGIVGYEIPFNRHFYGDKH